MTASIISAAAMVIVAIIEAVAARDRKRDNSSKGIGLPLRWEKPQRRPYSVFLMRIATGICTQRSTTLRRSSTNRKSF